MATWSGASFGGWDPILSIFESEHNQAYNRKASDYAAWTNYMLGKMMAQWSAEELPSMTVKGLEKAGLNPMLAVGGASASPATASGVSALSAPSSSHSSGGNPMMIAQSRAAIDQANSASAAQKELANLYKVQADRLKYIPITESDTGGFSILGTGMNLGGSDTLLFDTKTGTIVRPKDKELERKGINPAPYSRPSKDKDDSKHRSQSIGSKFLKQFFNFSSPSPYY